MADRTFTKDELLQQLNSLTKSLNIGNQEATLSTLKKIYGNIVKYPEDAKYRQIKLTDEPFSNQVWQYPAAAKLMKMSGWVVEGTHAVLRDDSHVGTVAQLLESVSIPSQLLFKAPYSETVITDMNHDQMTIESAIVNGNGKVLKEVLDKYDASSVKDIRLSNNVHIISTVLMFRQIGIARILAGRYQVDFNQVSDTGHPYHSILFQAAGDSSESRQSLMIEFIKDFKLDFTAYNQEVPVLHYTMLLKLFTVLKFLVEEHGVNVNTVSLLVKGTTCLHVAYGMKQDSMVKYLIEHGADQTILDEDGKKASDYRFSKSENYFSIISEHLIKKAKILDYSQTAGESLDYYAELTSQNVSKYDAVERVFKQFPSLEDKASSFRNLDDNPTLNELNHYITDMASSYYDIGLELDIVNSQLKLIKNDPSLFDLKEKCRKMLEVWLENDTSATWKKLCDALQAVELGVLAEQVAKG